jgi:hypothetical protein
MRGRKAAVDRELANAAGHGGKPPQRRLRIWKWKPVGRKGALAGFVSVEFSIGLRLADLPVFRTGTNGPWVGLPRVPVLDGDKRQLREAGGKLVYAAAFAWRDRETADAFSRAVLALLLAKYPDAIEERFPTAEPTHGAVSPAQEALL